MTALVLLPGLDGTGELFAPLRAVLEPGIDAQVIDYPTDERLTYRQLTAHVEARLPSRPCVLLGESFSGPIALSIAAKQPPNLRGVVLSCSFAANPRPMAALAAPLLSIPLPIPPTKVLTAVLLGKAHTPALEDLLGRALAKVMPSLLRQRLAEVLAVDVREQARRVGVPLLYLQANDDRLVPASAWNVVKSALPEARLQQIAGPHMLLQVNPVEAARAIREFMNSVEALD